MSCSAQNAAHDDALCANVQCPICHKSNQTLDFAYNVPTEPKQILCHTAPATEWVFIIVTGGTQEEQITRNILASWQVQRSMHSEVKRVVEVAKRKKRNERVVRLVDAAARGDVAEVAYCQLCCLSMLPCVFANAVVGTNVACD